jgi:spore germination protein (amino acid permease)
VSAIENSVTNRQMVCMLAAAITTMSSVTIAKTMALGAGHGAWFTILLAAVIFGAAAAVIVILGKMYEGKTLFDYSGEILGRRAPYVLGVIYLLHFTVLSTFYCSGFLEVLHSGILIRTPEWIILIFGMPVYGLLAYKGVTNIGRVSEIVVVIFFSTSIILTVTMFLEGRLNNILPLFVPSQTGKYIVSLKDAVEPFAGLEILTIIPFTAKNKKAARAGFFTIIGLGLFYLLDVYGCYAVMGMEEVKFHNFPFIDAIRLVEYKKIEFLQRVDIIYDTIGFMRIVVGKGIVYMLIVEYLCRLFPKAKRIAVVVATGAFLYVLSMITIGFPERYNALVPFLTVSTAVAAILIPLLLLIIAKVKRNAKKSR